MLKDERSRGGAGRSEKEVVREDENKEGGGLGRGKEVGGRLGERRI